MSAANSGINIWDKVAVNFGKVGPNYWEAFGARLVELSNIKSGARVLDIGMGRGASLFPTADKVGKDGYVIGIDSSEMMVNETGKDILRKNIFNAEVKNMEAQALDFEEETFHNIICGFGFGYLMLSKEKLKGILRILKKGGQAGFSIWGIQEDQKWLTEVVNKYLPPIKQNEDIKRQDIQKFDTVGDITKILREHGFVNIKTYYENSKVIYKDTKEWWQEMWTNAVSGIFEQIQALGIDVFTNFENDINKGLKKFNTGHGVCFNMPVIYAFGEKQVR